MVHPRPVRPVRYEPPAASQLQLLAILKFLWAPRPFVLQLTSAISLHEVQQDTNKTNAARTSAMKRVSEPWNFCLKIAEKFRALHAKVQWMASRKKARSASIIVPKDVYPNFVSSHGKISPFSCGPTAGFAYSRVCVCSSHGYGPTSPLISGEPEAYDGFEAFSEKVDFGSFHRHVLGDSQRAYDS
ncbi:hypothetical protein HispidOSU_027373 [Sigmodon hispidus]